MPVGRKEMGFFLRITFSFLRHHRRHLIWGGSRECERSALISQPCSAIYSTVLHRKNFRKCYHSNHGLHTSFQELLSSVPRYFISSYSVTYLLSVFNLSTHVLCPLPLHTVRQYIVLTNQEVQELSDPVDFLPDDWVLHKTLFDVSAFQVVSLGADTLLLPSGVPLSLWPFLPLPASHVVDPTTLAFASLQNTVLFTKPSFCNKRGKHQKGGYREHFRTPVKTVYTLEQANPLPASSWFIIFLQLSSQVNPCPVDYSILKNCDFMAGNEDLTIVMTCTILRK